MKPAKDKEALLTIPEGYQDGKMNQEERRRRYEEQKKIKAILMLAIPEGTIVLNKNHGFSWKLAKILYRNGCRIGE